MLLLIDYKTCIAMSNASDNFWLDQLLNLAYPLMYIYMLYVILQTCKHKNSLYNVEAFRKQDINHFQSLFIFIYMYLSIRFLHIQQVCTQQDIISLSMRLSSCITGSLIKSQSLRFYWNTYNLIKVMIWVGGRKTTLEKF